MFKTDSISYKLNRTFKYLARFQHNIIQWLINRVQVAPTRCKCTYHIAHQRCEHILQQATLCVKLVCVITWVYFRSGLHGPFSLLQWMFVVLSFLWFYKNGGIAKPTKMIYCSHLRISKFWLAEERIIGRLQHDQIDIIHHYSNEGNTLGVTF